MNIRASDDVLRQIADETEKKLDALGEEMAEWLRKLIGVPVIRQRIAGRETKTVIVRSQPGEPPRKDTGRLQASVQYVTYRTGWKIKLVISTNTPYAETLNRTRPYRRIFEDHWRQQIPFRLSYSVNQ
jgi:hypothetical protein